MILEFNYNTSLTLLKREKKYCTYNIRIQFVTRYLTQMIIFRNISSPVYYFNSQNSSFHTYFFNKIYFAHLELREVLQVPPVLPAHVVVRLAHEAFVAKS